MTYDDGFEKNAKTLRVKLDKLSEQAPNDLIEKRIEGAYSELDTAIEMYEKVRGDDDDA